jgi:hypothetical protein
MSPDQPSEERLVSFGDERERVIQQLSEHFANDRLSLEELETRIEGAYKATNVAALRRLTADLPQAAAAVPVAAVETALLTPERDRLVSIMSETRRVGAWLVPQRLGVLSMMADTTIDLTQATLPSGILDIHLRSLWAAVKIVVPPGVQVVSRISSVMASVHGGGEPDTAAGSPPWREATVVRLTGWALMAEVQVTVRRREE